MAYLWRSSDSSLGISGFLTSCCLSCPCFWVQGGKRGGKYCFTLVVQGRIFSAYLWRCGDSSRVILGFLTCSSLHWGVGHARAGRGLIVPPQRGGKYYPRGLGVFAYLWRINGVLVTLSMLIVTF